MFAIIRSMGKKIHDWKAVQEYHDKGHGFVACQRRFGFTHTAWIKAIKRGELRTEPSLFPDRRRRYDWAEIQAFYEVGNTYERCRLKFGFCAAAWTKARLRGEIRSRPAGMPIEELLVGRRCRTHVKHRLIRAGLLENRCAECGLSEWRGKPLSVHIDHINGIKHDNRLENLRMLCPNCHSQTHTYGGRNTRRRRLQDSAPTM
jgi:5-methylcytosine-specific restriction endonuclease McrA